MKVTKYDKIFSASYTKNKHENNEVFYANRLKINTVKVIRRLNIVVRNIIMQFNKKVVY